VNDDKGADKERSGFEGPFRGVAMYYWAVTVDDLRMEWDWNNKQEKYGKRDTIPMYDEEKTIIAIVDTGTSLLSMPQSVMDNLNKVLEELQFDCSRMKELPDLKFEIQGVTHMLAPDDYVAISDGGMSSLYKTRTVNDVAATIAMKKLFFHKPGKPEFIDKVTGKECMLLFTEPLGQTSSMGEMAILGMPFFREYEISFDFCTKEMYTKRSKGDCHNVVGQRPSNVQYCKDKDWVACWLQGLTDFMKSFWDGLVRIFSPTRGSGVDEDDRVSQKKHKLMIKPETLRLSSAATWLLESNQDGMVSI